MCSVLSAAGGNERIHKGPIAPLRVPTKDISWFSVPCNQLDLDDDMKIHFFITIDLDPQKVTSTSSAGSGAVVSTSH